jgi:anticodon-binding protein
LKLPRVLPAELESTVMPYDPPVDAIGSITSENPFTAEDIAAILRQRGWLAADSESQRSLALQAWLARAAELLGPHVSDQAALARLLEPVFAYDAAFILQDPANQDVLARSGAREVIRELAHRILGTGDIDSDRFKDIIESMKAAIPYRSRAMFHPIRLVLTGRCGEGELDRVILLLDSAAKLAFAAPVKTARQRMLEFCAALD